MVSQEDMSLYTDPEIDFLQSFEAAEYINKQIGWDRASKDFDFLDDNCPAPGEEVTVELQ